MKKVTIIDYGLSNLLSVQHAFAHFGAENLVTGKAEDVLAADALVLPGVGAFKDGMAGLEKLGLIEPIRQKAAAGTPLLGICLGMQMLFDESEEFGLHKGLGLIPGRVVRIPSTDVQGRPQKVPHISWDPLNPAGGRTDFAGTVLAGVTPGEECYFIHSYEAKPADEADRLADTVYGGRAVCAAAAHGSVVGCQTTLYDTTKAMNEASQDTSLPIIVFNAIKKHLKNCGASRGLEYTDERLSACAKRLMDMAVNYSESQWLDNMRTILMEELNMSKEMVYLQAVIGDTYNYMNDIKWGGAQTILAAIGQSVTVLTPAAVARYVCAIANGGKVYNLSIIDSITSPEGEILSQRSPTLISQLEHPEYLPLIHAGMKGVVDESGTAAKYFRGWKYREQIAAKTGTAEVTTIDLENNAWFVTFAPYENPEIAIAVFIPSGYSGGEASLAAKEFITWYMEQKDLRSTDYTLPYGNSVAP